MSISLDHVSKTFEHGGGVAVDDVTAEIPSGSLTAILGPSGAGKSTLLKLIGGLERPDSGRIVIEGDDVTNLDARYRDIGFCFQQYAPFRHMTVKKNVGYGLKVRHRPKKEIAAKVAELLELVKLSDLGNRFPSQLSGGERQRMALARALAIEPRVLLLDEPFGALDAQVRAELRKWVKELHEQIRVTTILVTHDQNEAMEVADQLLIMHDGHVEQAGPPTDLYDRPTSEFVRGFLGPITRFEGRAVRPHDLVLSGPTPGLASGTVSAIASLGFEVHVTTSFDDGSTSWIQMTRHDLNDLGISVGSRVSVRPRG
jgi:sulfate transport system ATP-binding protein